MPWLSVSAAGSGVTAMPMTVDGPLLARSYYARDTLYAKFSQALPAVVGDRDAWYAKTTADLDAVRATIDRTGPLPTLDAVLPRLSLNRDERKLVLELASRHPALATALWRLAWIAPHNGPVAPLTAFIAENCDELTTCAQRLAARGFLDFVMPLTDLVAEGRSDGARHLLRAVTELTISRDAAQGLCLDADSVKAAACHVNFSFAPLQAVLQYLKGAESDAGSKLIDLVVEMARGNADDWRHGVAWLEVLTPTITATPALDIACALEQVAERHEALILAGTVRRRARGRQRDALREALSALAHVDAWAYSEVAYLPQLIRTALAIPRSNRAWFPEAQRALGEMPPSGPGYAARGAFCAQWIAIAAVASADKLIRIVRWTRSFLASPATFETRIAQWHSSLSWAEDVAWTPEYRYFKEPASGCRLDDLFRLRLAVSDHWQAWERAMGWYRGGENHQEALVELAFELTRTTADVDLAVGMLDALAGRELLEGAYWLSRAGHLPAANLLARADVNDFTAVVKVMATRDQDNSIADAAATLVRDEGTHHLLLALARCECATTVSRIANQVAFLRSLVGEDATVAKLEKCHPPASLDAPWIAGFPQCLQSLILRLEAVESGAQTIANRYLKYTAHDSKEIREEILILRRLASEATDLRRERLLQRVTNLEERGSRPAAGPSQKVIEKARHKIERRVCEAEAALIASGLDAETHAAADRLLGVELDSTLIRDRDFRILFHAAARLPESYRSLAHQMLAASARGETRMYDHADNHAFAERMRRMGLDLAPWLEGDSRRAAEFSDGSRVQLEIEHDPARVMMMGAPFGTCLSPDGMNFHSAVLNAACANKAVVYARDGRGSVVGRCLLALTERGEILTYHRYTHGNRAEFEIMISTYVIALAARMGAGFAVRGRVADLVMRGWYDDGPVDIGGLLDFLKADSEFMRSVAKIPVGQLRVEIERRMSPQKLSPTLIPAVVDAIPDDRRSEIVYAFAEEILICDDLGTRFKLSASKLLRTNGHVATSRRIMDRLMCRRHAQRAWDGWWRSSIAEELVAVGEPSLALRTLRAGPYGRPRDWGDDEKRIAASAYEALRRPAQAKKMLGNPEFP